MKTRTETVIWDEKNSQPVEVRIRYWRVGLNFSQSSDRLYSIREFIYNNQLTYLLLYNVIKKSLFVFEDFNFIHLRESYVLKLYFTK